MSENHSRRTVIKGMGAAGLVTLTPQVSASPARGRFLVDVGEEVTDINLRRLEHVGLDVLYDIKPVGYVVVEGDESSFEGVPYDYVPDANLDLEQPVEELPAEALPDIDIEPDEVGAEFDPPSLWAFQWDKQSQDIPLVHQLSTGDGARVAVVDTGIDNEHETLSNLNEELSIDVTEEDDPFWDFWDHGTHVAGIIGATGEEALESTVGIQEDHLPESDVLWYELEDGAGDTVTNEAEEPDGTVIGAHEWVSPGAPIPENDYALRVTDDGGVDPNFTLEFEDDLTIDMHWRFDSGNDLAYLWNDHDSTSTGFRAFTEGIAGDSLMFRIPWGEDDIDLTENYQDGEWHQVRLVVDGEAGTTTVYIDGVQQGQTANTDAASASGTMEAIDDRTGEVVDEVPNQGWDGWTSAATFRAMGRENGSSSQADFDRYVFAEDAVHQEEEEGEPIGSTIGTAPDSELVSVRYFASDQAASFTGDFVLAITYAATPEGMVVSEELDLTGAGCDVINTSLGTPPLPPQRAFLEFFEQVYQAVADYADFFDCVWASSAGNDATNADRENLIIGPAGVDRVLCVASTGPIGHLWDPEAFGITSQPPYDPSYFTDHGQEYLDVSAPGGDVSLEAIEMGLDPFPPNGGWAFDLVFNTIPKEFGSFGWKAGTSMAAPQVAGAAALLKAEYPDLTATEVRHILKSTANDAGHATWHGWGHLNTLTPLVGEDPIQSRSDRSARGNKDGRSREDTGGGGGGGSNRRGRGRGGGGGGSSGGRAQ